MRQRQAYVPGEILPGLVKRPERVRLWEVTINRGVIAGREFSAPRRVAATLNLLVWGQVLCVAIGVTRDLLSGDHLRHG